MLIQKSTFHKMLLSQKNHPLSGPEEQGKDIGSNGAGEGCQEGERKRRVSGEGKLKFWLNIKRINSKDNPLDLRITPIPFNKYGQ